jgi:uncharacterized repeat protein (TIGR02543 family)
MALLFGGLAAPVVSGVGVPQASTDVSIETVVPMTMTATVLKATKVAEATSTVGKANVFISENGGIKWPTENKVRLVAKNTTLGSIVSTLAEPDREGYRFKGWFNKASGGSQIKATTKTKVTKDMILYAQWVQQVTVTFNLNDSGDGSATLQGSSARTIDKGKTLGTLSVPTRPGYLFKGWYTTSKSSGGSKASVKTKITKNIEFFARWNPLYEIKFDVNGGAQLSSGKTTKSVEKGKAVGALPTATRLGYSLTGWYPAGGKKITAKTKVTAPVTYYAQWAAKSYKISLDPNGGKALASKSKFKTVKYDSQYGTLPTTTRSGYTITGWWTAKSGGTKITSTSVNKVAGNDTLYAQWSVNTPPPTPTPTRIISFAIGNGVIVSPIAPCEFVKLSGVQTTYNCPGGSVVTIKSDYSEGGKKFTNWSIPTGSTNLGLRYAEGYSKTSNPAKIVIPDSDAAVGAGVAISINIG